MSATDASDPVNYHHTFDIDPPDCRAWCFNDGDLVLYDPADERAWLACEDAPLTVDYR